MVNLKQNVIKVIKIVFRSAVAETDEYTISNNKNEY